ncbi:DUF4197 domain-containing protein [Paucibacter oligotrophus]|uniref:DUF4197 domain-containing protein n=2 Tax=Roseateles oligotrophus TaxID=1769250 RepID=A0ABT2YDB3_9BURK|nr:DUF4197 domain-containing protein [Roseateles oligotrophus]MCV2368019.1 DUF4197 domain-containing protein [Roseateles oligotrophus]
MLTMILAAGATLPAAMAWAAVTESDAASGIRVALERGAEAAVAGLGKTDGFMGNPAVKIELPGYLKDGAKLLKMTGQGKQVDELLLAMNRAAEAAVPAARPLLLNAVKSISVEDALQIIKGDDASVTRFFAAKTREPLTAQFLPIVTHATEKVALAEKYNAVAGKGVGFGLVKAEDANIQQYVTKRALDGLFLMIAEEERKIRKDPLASGSALLKKVFGG